MADDDPPPTGIEAFADELDRLVEHFRLEWGLSYGEAVGALFFKAHNLCDEARERHGPEED